MAKFMKKELIIFFTVLFVAFFPIVLIPKAELAADSEKTETTMIGDLNNNGMIETGDVLMLLRHLSNESTKKHSDWELKGNSLKKADIVENNIINQPDVLALLRYIAAKSSSKVASKHPDWLSLIDKRNSVIVPTDITLDKATLKLMVGQKDKLTATVVPENAEDKRVYWKSSNEKVAEVDAFGNIKAVAEGECTVNATTWNGKTKACIVKITKYVAENGNTANNTNSTSTGSQPSVTGGGSGGGGGGYGDPGSSNPGTGNPGGPGQGNSEEGEEVELTGFEPTANPDTIFTYQSGKINIEYSPEDTTEKEMTYSVDTQGKDFTLNEDGSYKAGKDTGTFEINVESTDHPGMKKTVNVTVKPCRMTKIEIAGVDENKTKTWIWNNATDDKDGITRSVDAAIHPEGKAIYDYITDKDVEWMTSNSQLCTIVGEPKTVADHNIGRNTAKVNIKQPGIHMVFVSAKNTGLNPAAYDSCKIRVEGIKARKDANNLYVYMTSSANSVNLKERFDICGLDTKDRTNIKFEFIGGSNSSLADDFSLSDDGDLTWKENNLGLVRQGEGTVCAMTEDGEYKLYINIKYKN